MEVVSCADVEEGILSELEQAAKDESVDNNSKIDMAFFIMISLLSLCIGKKVDLIGFDVW